MEVSVDDDTGDEHFGQVWDYRHDPDGICFGVTCNKEAIENSNRIDDEWETKRGTRMDQLGYMIQPNKEMKCL